MILVLCRNLVSCELVWYPNLPMYKIYKSPKHSFSFVSFAPSGSPNLNPHLRNFLNCSNSIQWSFKWGREVVWGDKWVFWGRRGQMGERSALVPCV